MSAKEGMVGFVGGEERKGVSRRVGWESGAWILAGSREGS